MGNGNWLGDWITENIHGGAKAATAPRPRPPARMNRADPYGVTPAVSRPSAPRGGVGGGNAGASTASQWPAVVDSVDTTRTAPPALVTPRARVRQSALTAMAQQYDPKYWESQTGQAMIDLAGQRDSAGKSLKDYYRAQSLVGRSANPEIVEGLTMGLDGAQAKAMKDWASNNPMLAFREYNKRFPAGQPTQGSGELIADEGLKDTTQSFGPGGGAPAQPPGPVLTADDAVLRAQAAGLLDNPQGFDRPLTTDDAVLLGMGGGALNNGSPAGMEVSRRPVEAPEARAAALQPVTEVTAGVLRRHLEQAAARGGARNALYGY